MSDKETIRRIFNTLFLYKNSEGELMHRIATVGIKAKRNYTSNVTGESIVEDVEFPKMPLHPETVLPIGEGNYKEICIFVNMNSDYIIRMEDVELEGTVNLVQLFNFAKDLGKAIVVGKTYMDKSKKNDDQSAIVDLQIDGKNISITKSGNAYTIKDENDQDIKPDSAIGKEAIKLFVRKQLT